MDEGLVSRNRDRGGKRVVVIARRCRTADGVVYDERLRQIARANESNKTIITAFIDKILAGRIHRNGFDRSPGVERVGFQKHGRGISLVGDVGNGQFDLIRFAGNQFSRRRQHRCKSVKLVESRRMRAHILAGVPGVVVHVVLRVVHVIYIVNRDWRIAVWNQGDILRAVDARAGDEKAEYVVVVRIGKFAIFFRSKHIFELHQIRGRRKIKHDSAQVKLIAVRQGSQIRVVRGIEAESIVCILGVIGAGYDIYMPGTKHRAGLNTDTCRTVVESAPRIDISGRVDPGYLEAVATNQRIGNQAGSGNARGCLNIHAFHGVFKFIEPKRAARTILAIDGERYRRFLHGRFHIYHQQHVRTFHLDASPLRTIGRRQRFSDGLHFFIRKRGVKFCFHAGKGCHGYERIGSSSFQITHPNQIFSRF